MRAARCDQEEAAAYLRPVLGRKANPVGQMVMAELVDGNCYAVRDDAGQVVAAYVLRGQGSEVWVQAASGRADIDLCDLFDDFFARHGAGFQSIAFRTYRRGLVKKAQQRGYTVVSASDGYTMRKTLK